jgi:hypothetical protein
MFRNIVWFFHAKITFGYAVNASTAASFTTAVQLKGMNVLYVIGYPNQSRISRF